MTIDERAHDLALTAAKVYVESNISEYEKANDFKMLVDDLIGIYNENLEFIKNRIK